MAKSRRILSVMLAVLMVLTLVPFGMFSTAGAVSEDEISTASVGLDQSFLERPNINISSTAVIRTAASADSQAAGTTIVKATDSGLPELSGEKASAFYAGETPKNPMVVFTSDKALKTAPTITCSNAVLSFTLTLPLYGFKREPITDSRVDFPLPFAPTTEKISPFFTDKSTPESTSTDFFSYLK